MNNRTAYTLNFFLAAFLTGCYFLCSCENDEKKVTDWTKKVVMKEEATDIKTYFSQGGIMKAKLTAPLMIRAEEDTVYAEFPNGLHCDFYDSTQKVDTRLDAKYGKYFENLNKVYLRDSVVVISVKGDTLRSPDLWWDQNKKIFYTEQYATYHSKGMNVTGGKGLEATQDLVTVTFKQVTGNVKVADDGGLPEK